MENEEEREDSPPHFSENEALRQQVDQLTKTIEEMKITSKRKKDRIKDKMLQLVNKRTDDLLSTDQSWGNILPEESESFFKDKKELGRGSYSIGNSFEF